ncbi:MAG TPA: PilN domain-containing protein [Xanthomonadaceae bacterium]|nr:PilN domain-containing protein [Xanthomonadaceae bacterium]
MTPLRARLGRVGARLGPGPGGFLSWWGNALAAWLPRSWRALLGLDRGRLLLSPVPPVQRADDRADATLLHLRRQDADGLREVGQVPVPADPDEILGDLPRWLLLPAASGLARRLTLPGAAADRLRDVLGFEIDRQTPFAAADVAYDARVVRRRPDGQLDVDLVVVPLGRLQAQREALGPLAATLAGVDLAGGDGAPLGVNLLPPAQRRQVADPWRGWNVALAAIASLALVAGLWQVLDNRREAADAFEAALAPRAAQAKLVAAQRRELEAIAQGQAFLDRSRAARPTTVEILDELTRRLPDGTWLEKVSIEGDKLVVIGLSNEASALVRRLEPSPLWHSPALAGAVQPDPRTGRDRFSLVAELAAPVADPMPDPMEAPRGTPR